MPLKKINRLFFIICLFATVSLSIYSFSRYLKNEDLTILKDTNFFSSKEAIYPSLTFCILSPFLDYEFAKFKDDAINIISYIEFLKGEIWDDRLADIDYDNVTVSLDSNILGASLITPSKTMEEWIPTFYTSFISSERKCFTIDAPIRDHVLWYFNVSIKHTIFRAGFRSISDELRTYFHYPGQLFAGLFTVKYDYPSRGYPPSNYKMHFEIRDIDVLTRRNKIHEPCIESMASYDHLIIAKKLTEIGCYPAYMQFQKVKKLNLPKCDNASQMKDWNDAALGMNLHDESIKRPCRAISRIDYTYQEMENFDDEPIIDPPPDGSFNVGAELRPANRSRRTKRNSRDESYFEIMQVHRQTSFTDKMRTRAYTFDDVVGTVGGYIGLFLGYAMVQIPGSIALILNSIKQRRNKGKTNYVV